MGKPLKFDEPTSRFEPLKFVEVQVELEYSAPTPPSVWVPVLNCDEVEEKEKIEIQYPQLPYSCSLCKAFIHSLARCADNPNAPPRKFNQNKKTGPNSKKDTHNGKGNADTTELNGHDGNLGVDGDPGPAGDVGTTGVSEEPDFQS